MADLFLAVYLFCIIFSFLCWLITPALTSRPTSVSDSKISNTEAYRTWKVINTSPEHNWVDAWSWKTFGLKENEYYVPSWKELGIELNQEIPHLDEEDDINADIWQDEVLVQTELVESVNKYSDDNKKKEISSSIEASISEAINGINKKTAVLIAKQLKLRITKNQKSKTLSELREDILKSLESNPEFASKIISEVLISVK
jgi:hypothetical protein